ncbi:hypothetical protein PTKIN_Ptkin13bG0292900 [Pterospermum kingtungense]
MGSPNRLFNRQKTLHEILGGGLVADVMLWRRGNLTVGILFVTLAAWVVFEKSGYTLLSLVSSVLLLIVILFLWAKSAAILNRPAPPLPELHLSEAMVVAYLLLISVLGGLTDFLTLGYTSLVLLLTVLALYERYEDHVDSYVISGCRKMQQL